MCLSEPIVARVNGATQVDCVGISAEREPGRVGAGLYAFGRLAPPTGRDVMQAPLGASALRLSHVFVSVDV